MNQRILLNTVFALSIPSIAGFFTIPALALVQLPVPSPQKQQVNIPQSSAHSITLSKLVKLDIGHRNSLFTTSFLTQSFLISSGAGVVAPTEVNYNDASSNAGMQTPEGLRPTSSYYEPSSGNLQQPAANTQTTPSWQKPYWSNGNVCRERGADTVCLTPQEATNLRWLTPSR